MKARIKQAISMFDICRLYGIEVMAGDFVTCPFHREKTGSMKVYAGDKGWYCFGCNLGGDVIDFVMKYYGLPFQKAMQCINDEFHLGFEESLTPREIQKAERERRARMALIEWELKAFILLAEYRCELYFRPNDDVEKCHMLDKVDYFIEWLETDPAEFKKQNRKVVKYIEGRRVDKRNHP